MKVNMQPPPEDPFCGGARRAETPRPVDIKRDGGCIPSTLPHNFHLPPTSSRSLLFSTGASSASHPLGSGASASRAHSAAFFRRAMQSLGARRQPVLVPVARRTQPRAHETTRGRERRVGVGQILWNVLPDDRDRSSMSARLERARPRGFPEPASRRNGGLSVILHHDRRDSCSSWRAHARAAPSGAPRDPTRPTSAQLSHPKKPRASATALASTRLGSLGPPVLLVSEKRPAVIRGPCCIPFLSPKKPREADILIPSPPASRS
jgi:hypothetical protein